MGSAQRPREAPITITLTGQSMIRSDIRAAAPNELRIEAGDKENEATVDLPAPGNTPNQDDSRRILQSIHDARQHADLVIVYQHNHVFGNHSFATIFTEGMQERLAPNDWLKEWTHAEANAGSDIASTQPAED